MTTTKALPLPRRTYDLELDGELAAYSVKMGAPTTAEMIAAHPSRAGRQLNDRGKVEARRVRNRRRRRRSGVRHGLGTTSSQE